MCLCVSACATSHRPRDSFKPKRPSCNINKAIVCTGMDGRRPAGWSSCLLNNIKGSESRTVQSITPSLGPGRYAARAAAIFRARRTGWQKVEEGLNLNAQRFAAADIFLFHLPIEMKTKHLRLDMDIYLQRAGGSFFGRDSPLTCVLSKKNQVPLH